MPAKAKTRCYCGCGQADGVECRLRLVECQCGLKIRMTRQWIAQVTLSCSCGGELVPVCLEDRARSGDREAVTELSGRLHRSSVARSAGLRSAEARRNKAAARGMDKGELARMTDGASLIGAQPREIAEMPF